MIDFLIDSLIVPAIGLEVALHLDLGKSGAGLRPLSTFTLAGIGQTFAKLGVNR